ncbi:hypothetical protein ACFQ1E_17300 [Sphingomonas canadensis]|uniref:Uncharacterized protein n=1 Tax=Sphingomonas canadensis TaxID=1219257 RepID=A0ABW3H9H3_9SPHN|nr:hypothetical protein [Sphingomonas canadensis]MCW3837804.1 hypothetical protein [Sphingomonas canadensis]
MTDLSWVGQWPEVGAEGYFLDEQLYQELEDLLNAMQWMVNQLSDESDATSPKQARAILSVCADRLAGIIAAGLPEITIERPIEPGEQRKPVSAT